METFVIRVWTPGEPEVDGSHALHGLVEHVRAGKRHAFDGGSELLAFLERTVAAPTQERRSDA